MSQVVLSATETTGPAFALRGNPDRMTLLAIDVPQNTTAWLEARVLSDATLAWVQVDAVAFPVPGVRTFEVYSDLAYRMRASAAGPVVHMEPETNYRVLTS